MGYCDVYRNLGEKLLLSVDIRIENFCLDNISISDFGKKFISDIHIYIYVYIFFFFYIIRSWNDCKVVQTFRQQMSPKLQSLKPIDKYLQGSGFLPSGNTAKSLIITSRYDCPNSDTA